jgi:endoglucanase
VLLEKLTIIQGASGDEFRVREAIKSEVEEYCSQIKQDSMGNLYAIKEGCDKKIMLAAHMDEVGFMVTSITEQGMIKFKAIGSADDRVLASKKVLVGAKMIPGVIGMKPVHMQEKEERKQNIKIKQLYIDIGCSKKEEAEKLVSLGDYIYYDSMFADLGNGIYKSKAFDDRVGCAVLIEVLKESFQSTIQACFTVQEEIGMRGAGVAAYNVKPDLAIIIEGTTCSDVPNVEKNEMVTRMGAGPAVSIIDRSSYGNKDLVKTILETAKENNIKVQIKEGIFGGNDAGRIQTMMEGIPTAVISIPCRYIHSPNSVMCLEDYDNTIRLLKAVLKKLEE